jgi:hypothetical protein
VKMKQSDWPSSLSELAGFFASGPLWNATVRCEMQLPAIRFSRQKLRSETIIKLKNLPKRFERIRFCYLARTLALWFPTPLRE